MSSNPEGFIKIDSVILREIAQLHHDIVQVDKQSYLDNAIANLMKPKKFLWFDTSLTREKALKQLRDDYHHLFTMCGYNDSIQFAEDIIQSTYVSKTILISITTLNRLFSTMSDNEKAKFTHGRSFKETLRFVL